LNLRITQRAFAVALLLSLAITGGCMAIEAVSVSALAGAGQVMTSRSEDITQYDVYQGHRIWQSYSRDAVYELKRDVFYGKGYSSRFNLDALMRPAAPLRTVPSIDSYLADPTKWPSIKGVVPAGAKLRVRRVMYMQDLNVHDFYYIASFDDGPIAGQEVVINDISISNGGLGNPRLYDFELLERVSGR
jgi:hypothetical protein